MNSNKDSHNSNNIDISRSLNTTQTKMIARPPPRLTNTVPDIPEDFLNKNLFDCGSPLSRNLSNDEIILSKSKKSIVEMLI